MRTGQTLHSSLEMAPGGRLNCRILGDSEAASLISPQRAPPGHGRARRLLRRRVGPGQRSGPDRLVVPVLLRWGERTINCLSEPADSANKTCLLISDINLGSLYKLLITYTTYMGDYRTRKLTGQDRCYTAAGGYSTSVNRGNMEKDKNNHTYGGFE